MHFQFKEEVEKRNTGFCLPYKMDRGKIEDTGNGTAYSIKYVSDKQGEFYVKPISALTSSRKCFMHDASRKALYEHSYRLGKKVKEAR